MGKVIGEKLNEMFFLPLMKEKACSRESGQSCSLLAFLRSRRSVKNSTGIRPCHEPPGWDHFQAGDMDLLVPPITSLCCDAGSAAHSGRAAQ